MATAILALEIRADVWPALDKPLPVPKLQLQHPIQDAVFPANFPAPAVLWKTNAAEPLRWVAAFKAGSQRWLFEGVHPKWRPPEGQWQEIRAAALGGPVELIVAGLAPNGGEKLRARAAVRFTIGKDAVDYPLFYREVNLPFIEAVKDPSKIRWRFGQLEKGTLPPVVLENLPVCGNCHSFSRNGEFLAMDVDYANSKASYVITRTAPEMALATSDIISWNDYRKEEGGDTFGLLSQISPCGRYVLSTVKDRSVFVPRPDLAFSQLFFPLKGVLAFYDRDTRQFSALPGADDPAFVQSNPSWSPDGQSVIFARNKAAELEKSRDTGSILLTPEECEEFLKRGKEFRYDLYRVPFNEGKGGVAESIPGASKNGRSNYFPRYSPDGKWIVFCQASNYMLLQPDSELFIMPAQGGTPKRMACNLSRMNSWHSWSPDSKWLVFSSKAHSDYTQLYVSRISNAGEASPPVWLAHMVDVGRAANIPEFVNLKETAIARIQEQFLDDYSYTRAGNEFLRAGDADNAIAKYQTALSLNSANAMAHQRLGFLLFRNKNQLSQARHHLETAVRLEPRNGFAAYDLGALLAATGDPTNAVVHLRAAVAALPNGYDRQYNVIDMNYGLGETCYRLGFYSEAVPALETVLRRATNNARASYLLAMSKAWLGETDSTLPHFETAIRAEPRLAALPDFYDLLSRNFIHEGLFSKALKAAQKGFELAMAAGRPEQAGRMRERITYCRSRM